MARGTRAAIRIGLLFVVVCPLALADKKSFWYLEASSVELKYKINCSMNTVSDPYPARWHIVFGVASGVESRPAKAFARDRRQLGSNLGWPAMAREWRVCSRAVGASIVCRGAGVGARATSAHQNGPLNFGNAIGEHHASYIRTRGVGLELGCWVLLTLWLPSLSRLGTLVAVYTSWYARASGRCTHTGPPLTPAVLK